MIPLRFALALVPLWLTSAASPNGQAGPTTAAIDADVWTPVSASVANDDIAAMGRTYHPEAVLVTADATRPISQALAGWGKDMVTNKAKGTKATVALRFGKRQDDATTAFESGIFKYTVTDRAGASKPSYRRFESLLVKSNGKWRVLMEHQLDAVTETAWNALH